MPDDEAFTLNRWDWLLRKNDAPRLVIFSFDDRVRFAAKITSIEDIREAGVIQCVTSMT